MHAERRARHAVFRVSFRKSGGNCAGALCNNICFGAAKNNRGVRAPCLVALYLWRRLFAQRELLACARVSEEQQHKG